MGIGFEGLFQSVVIEAWIVMMGPFKEIFCVLTLSVSFLLFISKSIAQQSLEFERKQPPGEVLKIPGYELLHHVNPFSKGQYGIWAWHNQEYERQTNFQILPDYQINQITFVRGVGLVARCVYRRDWGVYHPTDYHQEEKDLYSVRMVNLKWLTVSLPEKAVIETEPVPGTRGTSIETNASSQR